MIFSGQIDVDDSCINQLVKKAKKYASVLLAENAPFIGRVVGALFAGPVGAEVVGTGINQTKKVINEVNKKELIWFEESAHFPNLEEYEKFNALAIRIKDEIEKDS